MLERVWQALELTSPKITHVGTLFLKFSEEFDRPAGYYYYRPR
jgi:hypothetical protein